MGMGLKTLSYQLVTFKNFMSGVQDCSSQHQGQFKWKIKTHKGFVSDFLQIKNDKDNDRILFSNFLFP